MRVVYIYLRKTEGRVDHCGQVLRGEGFEVCGAGGECGPDEGGVWTGEGKEGDGPGREEALICCSRVVLREGCRQRDGRYQSMAVVIPSAGRDGGEGANRAVETVGADEKTSSEWGVVVRKG